MGSHTSLYSEATDPTYFPTTRLRRQHPTSKQDPIGKQPLSGSDLFIGSGSCVIRRGSSWWRRSLSSAGRRSSATTRGDMGKTISWALVASSGSGGNGCRGQVMARPRVEGRKMPRQDYIRCGSSALCRWWSTPHGCGVQGGTEGGGAGGMEGSFMSEGSVMGGTTGGGRVGGTAGGGSRWWSVVGTT